MNYNTKLITANCINSINNNSTLNGLNYEIIVVDNNSTDFSMEFFQERKFENTKIIKNKKNDGFGKANNIGVNYSKGEFLVLLNSDTIVEETNFLNLLSAFEKNDEMGILSVKILNEDNTIQSVGFDLPSLRNELKLNLLFWNFSFIKNIRYKNYKNKQIFKVGWVSGCFMVMRQKDYHLVGGFDEKIFMYAEDIDLCYRLSKQKKYSYIFDETSIYHLHGKSGDKKNVKLKKMFENKSNFYYVIEKNNIFSKRKINISKFSFCMHAILLVSIKKIRNFVTRH
nr:glycosyltransferase family 2 protein [Paenibacillus odorifer]